jgi:hypothetical protein
VLVVVLGIVVALFLLIILDVADETYDGKRHSPEFRCLIFLSSFIRFILLLLLLIFSRKRNRKKGEENF